MARIENKSVYPLDTAPSLDDYVIGTDKTNNNKTKNYLIGDLINLVDGTALQDGLLSGGVTWLQNLQFEVSDLVVVIGGAVYNISGAIVTLDPANPTNPRIDVISINIDFLTTQPITVRTGVPAVTPAKPFIPDSTVELELTFVDIAAGATEPTGASKDLIYDENVGSSVEWDAVAVTGVIGAIDLAGTQEVNTGTISTAIATTATTGDTITYTSDSTHLVSSVSTIHLYIQLTATPTTINNSFDVTLYNGSTLISNKVKIKNGYNGFDTSVVKSYQSVIIPISDFNFNGLNDTITKMVITLKGSFGGVVYFDTFNLVSGVNNPPTTNTFLGLTDVNDSTYVGKAGYIPTVSDDELGMVLLASTSGDVTKVGTPVNNQLGVWTGDGTLEGDPNLTYDGYEMITADATEALSLNPWGLYQYELASPTSYVELYYTGGLRFLNSSLVASYTETGWQIGGSGAATRSLATESSFELSDNNRGISLQLNGTPTASQIVYLPDDDGTLGLRPAVTVDTSTSFPFALTYDGNHIVTLNNASPVTAIIPSNASNPFPIGMEITLINLGAGLVTVSVTTDTINQNVGGLTLAQYDKRTITKVAATVWILGY